MKAFAAQVEWLKKRGQIATWIAALGFMLTGCGKQDGKFNWFKSDKQTSTGPTPQKTFEIDEKTKWVNPGALPKEDRGLSRFFARKKNPQGWRAGKQAWPEQNSGWKKSVDDEEQEGLLARLNGSEASAFEPDGSVPEEKSAKPEHGFSLRGLFENPFKSKGVDWSIMCREFRGANAAAQADQIAEALRRTPGVKPDRVFVEQGSQRSRVFYGRYERLANSQTGEFDMPAELRADASLIKELAVEGEHYFIESRMMPTPKPNVGDSEWDIANNSGSYTLRVAIFYPQAGFSDWKLAAAEYCKELRDRGHPAYYRHGDFSSEVCVGSFGDDALVKTRKQGVLVTVPGPDVQTLQAKENFRYELWNMKTLADAGDSRLMRASHVVPVREETGEVWAAR